MIVMRRNMDAMVFYEKSKNVIESIEVTRVSKKMSVMDTMTDIIEERV